ncbi:hypothetical protein ABW21_db0203326 [Orbilia brochopaga]|nr:hypothetical protein ABW21_db0203326 [Drechslerella brochopaga]
MLAFIHRYRALRRRSRPAFFWPVVSRRCRGWVYASMDVESATYRIGPHGGHDDGLFCYAPSGMSSSCLSLIGEQAGRSRLWMIHDAWRWNRPFIRPVVSCCWN